MNQILVILSSQTNPYKFEKMKLVPEEQLEKFLEQNTEGRDCICIENVDSFLKKVKELKTEKR